MPDHLTMAEVAERLGKSKRWLQQRLADDRRRLDPRLAFHGHIGRTPVWSEEGYRALRSALLAEGVRRAAGDRGGPAETYAGPSLDARASERERAMAEVLAFGARGKRK